jgi:hypothetical protein
MWHVLNLSGHLTSLSGPARALNSLLSIGITSLARNHGGAPLRLTSSDRRREGGLDRGRGGSDRVNNGGGGVQGAVTIIFAVSYNGHNTSFAINLTCVTDIKSCLQLQLQ